jgi:alpha-glucosidase
MNYYFIYGPQMEDVVTSYTDLTGNRITTTMGLGYHQCKWSYYPESNVKEITAKFRELKIPCDAIYLDIDYMEGFRCFTWNKEYFPDPECRISSRWF